MIGKLKGLVDNIESDHLIIDVGGVGYIVACSGKTLSKLPSLGEAISLLIETHVREDSINLYGFYDQSERDWFRQLITVKGVGAKLALIILGYLDPSQLNNSLAAQDKQAFKQVSGVGPKLAERIVTELKDKFVANISYDNVIQKSTNIKHENNIQNDAISALTNLGYSKTEAYNITSKILTENNNCSLSELIKLALKGLTL
jgi:Holliday junction DNA helicase RuvA